jgi:Kef-type K+ transport system membrane component KefB
MELREVLLALATVWLAAKLAGEALERVGQTAVLGELLAGVLIGPGMLGLVHSSEILRVLAEIGVVILLFEIGLQSDLAALLRAGVQATLVAVVGMKVQPAILNPFGDGGGLTLALMLTAVAVVSKLSTGLAVYRQSVRRWPVAVGMVPRGEVGLIFAGIGLAAGVIDDTLYAAVVVTVMLTTFLAPPWLKILYRV